MILIILACMVRIFLRKKIYKFFLKTHQQNIYFSLYYRGSFLNDVFFLVFIRQNILSNNLEGGFHMNKNCSGQFFLLPNRIFDERLSPNEFIVYSFLVRAKDSAGQSFWPVPMIAKSCSMCASTCRKVLHSLESAGYITISKRFIGGEQKSNLYTVNKI